MKIDLFQVDAFASVPFKGNPAAVCPMDKWLDDKLLQSIALENNLSETAFFVPSETNVHPGRQAKSAGSVWQGEVVERGNPRRNWPFPNARPFPVTGIRPPANEPKRFPSPPATIGNIVGL